MKEETVSRAFFAVVLIGLGILGLIKGDFAPGIQPVPESLPGRQVLPYFISILCVACGAGLMWSGSARLASRSLFFFFLCLMIFLRLPWLLVGFSVGTWWSASSTALITAAAWLTYISVVNEMQTHRDHSFTGDKSVRIARVLFGLGLIPLGLAHFIYLEATATVVPAWLQWPVFWSYFTGAAFIAAGLAIITGIFARLAATLVTVQLALLTLLVWAPRVVDGSLTAFQWGEVVVSILLTSCAWVVADSYRGTPWHQRAPHFSTSRFA